MLLRGTVFSGALRGGPLVEKHSARLIGLVGFRPYPGTLDVELDINFDLAAYAHKRIEHIRPWGGGHQIDAHLAPATIRKSTKSYPVMEMRDREKEILDKLKQIREKMPQVEEVAEGYPCWVVQFAEESPDHHVIEIIAKEELRPLLDIKDGDKVEIVISEYIASPPQKKKKFRELDLLSASNLSSVHDRAK